MEKFPSLFQFPSPKLILHDDPCNYRPISPPVIEDCAPPPMISKTGHYIGTVAHCANL